METVLQIKILAENIGRNDILIKNKLKDMMECESDIRTLNRFSTETSKLINQTRENLTNFNRLIQTIEDGDMAATFSSQHDSMQNQLQVNIVLMQRTVISAQRRLMEKTRGKLLTFTSGRDDAVRRRTGLAGENIAANEEMAANQSANLTESLQSVNRMLANQVERSSQNLDTLVTSSAVVTETHEEFRTMSNYIANSKTLLNKYGRRELTDKVLVALAIAFFFGCVAYVVVRRLYWK